MAPLANQKVLVVGGTSGIGFAVAKAALAEGAHVVISSSNPDKVAAAAKRLGAGDRVTAEVLDVGDEAGIKALFVKLGRVDHVVTTAGSGGTALGWPNLELEQKIKDQVFDTRFWGSLHLIKHAHAAGAQSVTLTSGTAAERPKPGWTLSVAAGGALSASLRTAAVDLAPLRVNCVAPGAVDTELWDKWGGEFKSNAFAEYEKKLPVRHVGTPEEVAEAYLFTMKCTYFTGQTIFVDGGQLLV